MCLTVRGASVARQRRNRMRYVPGVKIDEVILQDKSGRAVDVAIYGDSSYKGEDWQDEPLRKPREEMIFKRKGIQDTNQCEWLLLPFGASYHAPEIIFFSGDVTAFVSPDCSFPVLHREIDNATSPLCINLYQFENPYLMDMVLDALNREVTVYLLLEGSPVGGIRDEELYIAEKIKERGGAVRFSHDPRVTRFHRLFRSQSSPVLETYLSSFLLYKLFD
jgi:cardiolipin synthase